MKNKRWRGAIAALLAGTWLPAAAIEVLHLAASEKIRIDGRLDEPAWARAPVLDRFWEIAPIADVPALVRTEARFAYDREALYVAVRAYDPDPSRLREPFARRDNVLADQDMIELFVDPVGNRKFAHFFRVNPRGSIGDGLYNEDTANADFSPDFDFEVATGRFEGGWTAEFRIPFSSLRYTDPPSREWSVLVVRDRPREQLYRSASSKLPREQTCFLCLNEPLTGLDELPSSAHLQATPNATVRTTSTRDAGEPAHRQGELVPSLDLKWRPRADVVVDATINPDFSQVELDTPQLAGNTQFALFYPEKRPFFLEGADIFQSPLQALYTRSVTDPAWGARATRRAEGFDGTVMVARDDGGGLVLLPNSYTTGFAAQDSKSVATFARGRWQRDGATFGGLFTDRTLDDGSYNRVAGPDVVWFPTTEHRLRAQALGSWTTAQPGIDGTLRKGPLEASHAALADWLYHGREWDQYLDYEDVGDAFRADNGFIVQNGYRKLRSETSRKFLEVWGFNDITPYANLERRVATAGGVVYEEHYLGVRYSLPRATTGWIEARPNSKVAVVPEGRPRKRDQVSVGIESNPFPWLSKIHYEIAYGDRLDVANNRIGKGAVQIVQLNLRPHERLELEYQLSDDFVDSREPVEGSSRIIGQRAQQLLAFWHFSARDTLRVIWQATGVRRAPSLFAVPVAPLETTETLSLVYGYRQGISRTFYVGATASRDRIPAQGVRHDQVEVFAKASWMFDLL